MGYFVTSGGNMLWVIVWPVVVICDGLLWASVGNLLWVILCRVVLC